MRHCSNIEIVTAFAIWIPEPVALDLFIDGQVLGRPPVVRKRSIAFQNSHAFAARHMAHRPEQVYSDPALLVRLFLVC